MSKQGHSLISNAFECMLIYAKCKISMESKRFDNLENVVIVIGWAANKKKKKNVTL